MVRRGDRCEENCERCSGQKFQNSLYRHHFKNTDLNKLKQLVFEFFSMGTGGPHQYTGRDMVTAHTGLHISGKDFLVGNDDVLLALEENGVGQAEKEEVIAILD